MDDALWSARAHGRLGRLVAPGGRPAARARAGAQPDPVDLGRDARRLRLRPRTPRGASAGRRARHGQSAPGTQGRAPCRRRGADVRVVDDPRLRRLDAGRAHGALERARPYRLRPRPDGRRRPARPDRRERARGARQHRSGARLGARPDGDARPPGRRRRRARPPGGVWTPTTTPRRSGSRSPTRPRPCTRASSARTRRS